MTTRRWILIACLLIVLVVSASAVLLLPFFAGPDYSGPEHLKAFFLTQLERNIGRDIEVGRVKLSVFPSIRLELVDFVIRDADPSQVFLRTRHADLVLRLLPLLRGKVVGKRFTVTDPSLTLRRDKKGDWNFLAVPKVTPEDDTSIGNPLRRLLVLRELTIQNGKISVIDETPTDGPREVLLDMVNLAMKTSLTRSLATLGVSANISGALGTSSVSLLGTITPTASQIRISQENAEGLIPTFQFAGRAKARNVNLRQLIGFFDPRPIPDRLTGTIDLDGQLRLVPGVVGYDMVLSEMTAHVNQSVFGGQASLSGLMTGQPTFALTFSSSQLEVDDLLDIIPAQWIHAELPTIIAEREIRGTLEVDTATLTGIVTPERRLSMTGELRVTQGHALIDRSGTAVENVTGTVLLEPERIRVLELSGMYGKMQVDAGKVVLSFPDAGPWLKIALKGRMAAADVVTEMDIGKRFNFEALTEAWTGLQDVQGVILVGFRLAGPMTEPEKITYLGAAFEPLDVSFRSKFLPRPVTGLNGRFVITDKGTQFDEIRGWLGQTQIQVHGRIVPGDTTVFQDFTITTRSKAEDLLQLLPADILSDASPRGTVGAVLGLSGPVKGPRFKGALDLDDTQLDIPGLGPKPRGRQASLEFEGAYGKRQMPFLNRLELVLPTMRIAARGTIQLEKPYRVIASVGFGPIAATLLPDWIRPGGLERGEVEVSLDLRGKGKNWAGWKVTGWVALTDGVFSAKGIDGTVRDLNLRVKLVPGAAELKQLAFRILDSDVRLTGLIRNWQKRPIADLTIESNHFDIDLLVPKRQRSPLRDFLEDVADSSLTTVKVHLKRGTYKLLSLTDLSCRVNMRSGVIDVDRIAGKAIPGSVSGRIVIRLPKRKPASVESAVRLTGVHIEEFNSLFNLKTAPMDGDLFLTGSLRGHGRHSKGVYPTLNGKAQLRITNGRIFKDESRPIWKILGTLNFPAVMLHGDVDLDKDGLPFDEITSTIMIEDGHIMSEDFLLNSPVVKMTAAGTYDLPGDELDYIVAVSPFGPYSRMLDSVPLFGTLLKGERKGIATALFSVTGSIEDPQVEYLPIRSVATGIGGLGKLALDMLVNIVTLPKELIAPSEKQENGLNHDLESIAPPLP